MITGSTLKFAGIQKTKIVLEIHIITTDNTGQSKYEILSESHLNTCIIYFECPAKNKTYTHNTKHGNTQ